jgi:hypothetical protein
MQVIGGSIPEPRLPTPAEFADTVGRLTGPVFRSCNSATICFMLVLASFSIGDADAAGEKRSPRRRVHNLPPIVSVPQYQWTLAEEVNVSDVTALSNTTIDYGIADNWNVGLSVLNATLGKTVDQVAWDPDLLLNIEKNMRFSEHWAVVLGTQFGTAPWDQTRSSRIEYLAYLDNQILLAGNRAALHAGLYLANGAMSGLGTLGGYLLGVEMPLGRLPLRLSLDYLSGRNNLSTLSLQCRWTVLPHLDLGWGVQIAAPGYVDDSTACSGSTGNDGLLTLNSQVNSKCNHSA